MKCSHGLPLESKCELCTKAALALLRSLPAMPPESASREQKQVFWANQYRGAIAREKNHT